MLVSPAATRGVRAYLPVPCEDAPLVSRELRELPAPPLRRTQSMPNLQDQLAAPHPTPPLPWTSTVRAPKRPPEPLPAGRSHLPKEGEHGHWLGKRGESGWLSNHLGVQRITEGAPVIYRDTFPDFSPWAVHRLKFPWLTLQGDAADMMRADTAMAEQYGCQRADITRLRREARLLWHHCQDGQTMLLVPIDLHMHVPHTGGASMLRRLRERHAREAAETGFSATWREFPPTG